MKKIITFSLYIVSIFIFNCSKGYCTKTIETPSQNYITSTGSTYIPGTTLIVPCDYVIPPIKEQLPLQNFSYEVLDFTFTKDTGNNTNRLKFDIKLINTNNFAINGFAYFTVNVDGTVSSSPYLNGASSTCNSISANSSCVFSFEGESSLDLGLVQSISLVNVQYYLSE